MSDAQEKSELNKLLQEMSYAREFQKMQEMDPPLESDSRFPMIDDPKTFWGQLGGAADLAGIITLPAGIGAGIKSGIGILPSIAENLIPFASRLGITRAASAVERPVRESASFLVDLLRGGKAVQKGERTVIDPMRNATLQATKVGKPGGKMGVSKPNEGVGTLMRQEQAVTRPYQPLRPEAPPVNATGADVWVDVGTGQPSRAALEAAERPAGLLPEARLSSGQEFKLPGDQPPWAWGSKGTAAPKGPDVNVKFTSEGNLVSEVGPSGASIPLPARADTELEKAIRGAERVLGPWKEAKAAAKVAAKPAPKAAVKPSTSQSKWSKRNSSVLSRILEE